MSGDENSKGCRILYVVGQLSSYGGLERQLYYLLEGMGLHRYRPGVVVWGTHIQDGFSAAIQSMGVSLYFINENDPPLTKLLMLQSLVKKLSPEVVHSYSFFTNFAAWWSTLGTEATPVGSIRSNFVSERQLAGHMLGRLSARWPRTQICNSIAAMGMVQRTCDPFKPSRLRVVRNRLDIDCFKADAPFPSEPLLIAVGRLSPQKRWDRLVRAVSTIAKKGIRFSVHQVGVGPLREHLEEQAGHLGVDHLIKFLGFRHDIPRLLAESTFLVHTANDEGCPNVVMEAMAAGRAVVATDAGDIPYLVEDGKTGFVVPRGDEEALADRMMTLISNHDLCLQMGKNARRKAEKEFGLRYLATETLEAYQAFGWRG